MSTEEFGTGFAEGSTQNFSTGWTSSTTGGSSSGSSGGFALARNRGIVLEEIVRPFETERILALRARRKAREEDRSDDSLIRWGRPSEYDKEATRGGFTISNSNPKRDPQQQRPRERVYTEINRVTETVRVRNPTDSNQYVDVARIKTIRFRGPDGLDVRFDLKPPPGEVIP
jgi:hypothetical protein